MVKFPLFNQEKIRANIIPSYPFFAISSLLNSRFNNNFERAEHTAFIKDKLLKLKYIRKKPKNEMH